MAKITVGLDAGNGSVKAYNGSHSVSFDAGFNHTYTEDTMEWNGQRYTFEGWLEPESDKTKSGRWMAYTLYAIVKLLEESGANHMEEQTVDLAVNIPGNRDTKENREKYTKYFDRNEKIIHKGKMWKIHFSNVVVMPEGMCVFMMYSKEFIDKKRIALIDIGSRDIKAFNLAYDNRTKKWKIQNKAFPTSGVMDISRRVRERLGGNGIHITNDTIFEVIAGEDINHQESKLIKSICKEELEYYLERLIPELINNEIDLGRPIVLVGGGADILFKELNKRFNVIRKFGFMANAEALYNLLILMPKRK